MNQLYTEKFVKDEKCDWLVFIHGFGGSTKMWKRQIDSFKDKFNLLILDLPGHGKSKEGIAHKGIKRFVIIYTKSCTMKRITYKSFTISY